MVKYKRTRRLPMFSGAEQILLALEIGAVFLFVAVGVALWQTRLELNDTYRNLQQTDPRLLPQSPAQVIEVSVPPLPTLYPTATPALVTRALAPAPLAGLQVENNAERKLAAEASSSERDADIQPGSTVVMQKRVADNDRPWRLNIPAIEVDSVIFQEYDENWLKLGVVRIGHPVTPGDKGNLVLVGHNNIYGEIFRDLDQLQAGDEVRVANDGLVYAYRVREILIVEPKDIWVTLPTSTPTLTLVSCYPYLLGTERIVVFADLVP